MAQVKIGPHVLKLPASRLARVLIGIGLIIGGIFSFLPVLGIWMIPLGLIILSVDSPLIRRKRREWTVKYGAKLKARFPSLARIVGFNGNGNGKSKAP